VDHRHQCRHYDPDLFIMKPTEVSRLAHRGEKEGRVS
jgi:ferredoxin